MASSHGDVSPRRMKLSIQLSMKEFIEKGLPFLVSLLADSKSFPDFFPFLLTGLDLFFHKEMGTILLSFPFYLLCLSAVSLGLPSQTQINSLNRLLQCSKQEYYSTVLCLVKSGVTPSSTSVLPLKIHL